jgi:hypothetical protein
MSQATPRHEMTLKKLVYEAPGMGAVTVRRDVEYRSAEEGALTVDLYYPADAQKGDPPHHRRAGPTPLESPR